MRLRDGILEVSICLVVIALSVVGTASAFVTGLRRDIDGLLLILVCALMGSLFSTTLFVLAKQEGWLAHLAQPRRRPVVGAPHIQKPCQRGKLALGIESIHTSQFAMHPLKSHSVLTIRQCRPPVDKPRGRPEPDARERRPFVLRRNIG